MLKDEILIEVKGGGISATLLNSLSRFMDTLYSLGQTVGSTLRRLVSKKVCKISWVNLQIIGFFVVK